MTLNTSQVPIGLKHHLITHTGETPFLCLHCWKSFSSHIDLKLHIKKEHLMHLNTDTGGKAEDDQEWAVTGVSPAKSYKAVKAGKRTSGGLGNCYDAFGSYFLSLCNFQKERLRRRQVTTFSSMTAPTRRWWRVTSWWVLVTRCSWRSVVFCVHYHIDVHSEAYMSGLTINIQPFQDQDGQKMVVVNPAPGDEPQTIVVPEQAETVYVIGDSLTAGWWSEHF